MHRNNSRAPDFRPPNDVALLHLWHPVIQHTLQHFARRRFPGTANSASRWTVGLDPAIPDGTDAWVLLTIEEIGVNELRETVHHWLRTLVIPVSGHRLGAPLPHRPAAALHAPLSPPPMGAVTDRARALWNEVEPDLRDLVAAESTRLTGRLRSQLTADRREAEHREEERFRSRQGELSALITETRIDRLERDLDLIQREQTQGHLLDPDNFLARLRDSADAKQAELLRLRQHIEDLRGQLQRERDRVLRQLIPNRFALRGEAQCLPVAVEIRFPPTSEVRR